MPYITTFLRLLFVMTLRLHKLVLYRLIRVHPELRVFRQ